MTREKKTIYTIITNILLQLVLAVSGFVIPRLILSAYGSTMNGLINSIAQFLTYAGLVEAGVGNAAIVALYKPFANQNYGEISRISTCVKRKYFISGLMYTGIVVLLAVLYPLTVKNQLEYGFVVSMVFIIAAVSAIDYFIIGKYKVLLVADQKYYVINAVRIIATIILIIGSCLLLLYSQSLFVVKGLAVVTHLGEALVIKLYVKQKYPSIDFKTTDGSIIIRQQSNALIHQISNVVTYNTDLVVLTVFLSGESLKEISVYTVYALAFGMINNLMTSFTTGIDATFGNMIARRENLRLNKFYNAYEYWYLILLYSMYCCFIVLIIPFVNCYTKGIDDINYIRPVVGLLFGINGVLAELKDPLVAVVKAHGDFQQTQKFAVGEAVVNIVISVILVKPFGIVGVLIGTIISHIFADIGFIVYANRDLLQRKIVESLKNNFLNTFVLVGVVFVEFRYTYHINGWGDWILAGVAFSVINISVFILLNAITNFKNFQYGVNFLRRRLSK